MPTITLPTLTDLERREVDRRWIQTFPRTGPARYHTPYRTPSKPSRLMRVKSREELLGSGWTYEDFGGFTHPNAEESMLMDEMLPYSGRVIDWNQPVVIEGSTPFTPNARYFSALGAGEPVNRRYYWTPEMFVEISQ